MFKMVVQSSVTQPTSAITRLCRHFEKTLRSTETQHNTTQPSDHKTKHKTSSKSVFWSLCVLYGHSTSRARDCWVGNNSIGVMLKREVKLLCPSLSKVTTQLVVWNDHKIDLGSIARAFGLDPSTLRLNGHFISRGVDLISSSVTWNSLLSFFSSKGFSTDALLVTGKLCRVGNKSVSLFLLCFPLSSLFCLFFTWKLNL